MNKKVAIIGTVGLPSNYGGFETLAEYLTKEKGKEFDFTVYCSTKAYDKKIEKHNGAKLKYIPLNANGFQSIAYDIISIIHAIFIVDILLILGISGGVILPIVKLFSNKQIIINIDGIEWKRNKWGKIATWFLKVSEKVAVNYADVVVADNPVIQNYLLKNYGKKSELIAYGSDHSKHVELTENNLKEHPFLKENYAFKVCRIVPENNLQLILTAFSSHSRLNLVIVGNWSVSSYSKKLKAKFEKCPNIYLIDPIYDQTKLNRLRSNCYVYIHGHSAGGTNPSLVEAMFLGLPVLAYGINFNRKTTQHQALYFEDVTSLCRLLDEIDEEQLNLIGESLHKVASKNYTWKIIANKYAAVVNNTFEIEKSPVVFSNISTKIIEK